MLQRYISCGHILIRLRTIKHTVQVWNTYYIHTIWLHFIYLYGYHSVSTLFLPRHINPSHYLNKQRRDKSLTMECLCNQDVERKAMCADNVILNIKTNETKRKGHGIKASTYRQIWSKKLKGLVSNLSGVLNKLVKLLYTINTIFRKLLFRTLFKTPLQL